MLSKSNNYILKTYILHKYNYFSSFGELQMTKNSPQQLGSVVVKLGLRGGNERFPYLICFWF